MVFRPLRCSTRWEGVAIAGWILLIDLLFLIWMWRRPVDWLKFVLLLLVVASVPLFIHIAYRTWAAFSLEYWIDRNAITLRWANTHQVIPLHSVRRIVRGGVSALEAPGWLNWPAPYIGGQRALGLLNITSAATRPLADCLVIDADEAVFAVSPEDSEQFLTTLQEHYQLGPVMDPGLTKVRASVFSTPLEQDRVGLTLLGAGLAGVLLLFGLLMMRFPDLPEALAFHYNSDGIPDVVRDKAALFLLPGVGLLAWLINGTWGIWMAFRKERTGAYMLWCGTLIVQACSLLALTNLIR